MTEMILNGTTKNELIRALADNCGEISENITPFRIVGEGAHFKLYVTTADGEMIISQDGINHHLRPSSI